MSATSADAAGTRERTGDRSDEQRPRRSRWFREVGWRHLAALLACAFALFPVVYVLSASFSADGSLSSTRVIPADFTFDNYTSILTGEALPFIPQLWNSLKIAGGAAVLNTFMAAAAAYAFSRMRFKGRRIGLLSILLIQMYPALLAVVALFVIFNNLGNFFEVLGIGRQLPVFLVYLAGSMGVNTWLIKGFYDTVPSDLDEAAKIDGATHNQIFFQVILPLVRPVLAVVMLLSFVFLFNEFILASALLAGTPQENLTLPLGMQGFIDERYGSRWGPFAAGAVIGGVPIILLFLYLQKYIVSGLTAGSVKG